MKSNYRPGDKYHDSKSFNNFAISRSKDASMAANEHRDSCKRSNVMKPQQKRFLAVGGELKYSDLRGDLRNNVRILESPSAIPFPAKAASHSNLLCLSLSTFFFGVKAHFQPAL